VRKGFGVLEAGKPARLVLLVTTAVFINYVDRGKLSTAAPLMQTELHLSATQLGILLAAFYYSYVLCMPATGWLTERFGAKSVLAAGITVWSMATALTGFAGGFLSLLALRLLLGVGESVAFPCASKVLAEAVKVERLGVANGILGFGYLLGPAVGTLLGGLLMSRFGWRPVFILFGLLSLSWLWPWHRAEVQSGSQRSEERAAVPVPMSLILRQRALWGAAVGHFASNYTYYFILSWLPFYLVKSRGLSLAAMAMIASWAYLLNAISALAMGTLQDRWIRNGHGTTGVYKGVMGSSHILAVACMLGMVLLPERGSVIALFVFGIVSGASYPGLFAIPQIMAGTSATGRWVGLQNAAGNVAGLVAPLITGVLVDSTGGFGLAFALAALVNVLGFLGWVFLLPAVRPLDWAVLGRKSQSVQPSA
jgi:MFS family permease